MRSNSADANLRELQYRLTELENQNKQLQECVWAKIIRLTQKGFGQRRSAAVRIPGGNS
jgi:hypothetical protein